MGMFDSLKAPAFRDELAAERADSQRMQFMAQDPFHAGAMTAYEGANLAGEGLARTAAGLMGRDTRTQAERQRGAVAAAKAEMAKMNIDLSTPEGRRAYYQGMQEILRRNGLPVEAHEAAAEGMDAENKALDRQTKQNDIDRKALADREKAANAKRKLELDAERNAILLKNGMPNVIKMIEAIDKQEDGPTRDRMIAAYNTHLESQKKGITLEQLNDRVIVRDKATGAVLGTDLMGEKPMDPKTRASDAEKKAKFPGAYAAAMAGLQAAYKTAADLHNHPGLDNLVGRITGIAASENTDTETIIGRLTREFMTITRTDAGLSALGLWKQVRGETFIRALKDLKDASPTGASGLGQLSNAEGDKIGSAKANLFSRQNPADFRVELKTYIETIMNAAERLNTEAAATMQANPGMNLPLLQLATVPLTGPASKGRKGPAGYPPRQQPPRAPVTPVPAAPGAAPAPAAPGGAVYWDEDADGNPVQRKR
jgi:hypothetical protein